MPIDMDQPVAYHPPYNPYPRLFTGSYTMRTPKDFPASIEHIWIACFRNALPVSPPDDPCYPNTAYLEFPNRKSCDRCRQVLNAYRHAHQRASMHPRLSVEMREYYGRMLSHMTPFSVVMRNPAFPSHSGVAHGFYDLPDGPHRLYFKQKHLEFASLTSQFTRTLTHDETAPIPIPLRKGEKAAKDASLVSQAALDEANQAMEDIKKMWEKREKKQDDDEFWQDDDGDAEDAPPIIWCANCGAAYDASSSCPNCPTSTSDL